MKTVGTIRLAEARDRALWDKTADHPLQSWSWGEFRQKTGLTVLRLIDTSGAAPAVFQMTLHPIPLTRRTIGYIPRSVIPTKRLVSYVCKEGKSLGLVAVQSEPDVDLDAKLAMPTGFIPAHRTIFAPHTYILDLNRSESEMLAAMHHKTRYNIKLASRHGVSVEEDNSDAAFETYLALSMETARRQGFFAHNPSYHRKLRETLGPAGMLRLFTARYNGNILSAFMLFIHKDTVYYPYGASSREHREVMAPTALMWETIRWAKTKGFRTYDMWGSLGPNPDPKDPFYGFHRFKQGFNPTLRPFIGSFELPVDRPMYRIYRTVDTIRWGALKLHARTRA